MVENMGHLIEEPVFNKFIPLKLYLLKLRIVIEKNNNTIKENLCFVPFFKKADLIAIMKSSLFVSILS